jgi:hypothetical protein
MEIPDEDDSVLSAEELLAIAKLSPDDSDLVDRFIVASCQREYRKVALITGLAFLHFEEKFSELSPKFYLQRIKQLVSKDVLVAAGDLNNPRHSEVRLGLIKGC